MNESYILKTSEYPTAHHCTSILDPASEPASPRSPWDTVNDRTLDDTSDVSTYTALSVANNYILGLEMETLRFIYSLFYSFIYTNVYWLPTVCKELCYKYSSESFALYPVGLSPSLPTNYNDTIVKYLLSLWVVLGTVVVIYTMSHNNIIILQGRSWCSHFITEGIESEKLVIFSE